jgi:hypothetical protein
LRIAQNADFIDAILEEIFFDNVLFTRFFISKSSAALVRKFKAKDKLIKRGLTGAESAEKERQIAKAIKTKKKEG